MIPPSTALGRDEPPALFMLRIAIVFCAPLVVNGFALPYFPVWVSSLSMTDLEVATILALPMFLRVVTAPLVGQIADKMGERAHVLVWSAILSLLTALALFVSQNFWFILIVYALQGAVYSPYVPIVEAISLTGVRRFGFDYARMRVWGSIAFIGATMVGGAMMGIYGSKIVLPAMALSFLAMVLVSFLAPRMGPPRRPSTLTSLTHPPPKALRKPDLQLLLVGVTLINGSHAMLFAFSAIYWTHIGFSGTEIGLLWSAGVAAEVVMFFCAKAVIRRFSIWSMILSGCSLAVVRWLIFPNLTEFYGFFLLQCFHAFTYAIMHTGMQNRLVTRVPEAQEASAQGLYFFYTGIFTAIFTFVSGYFYTWYGVKGFYLMSVVALVGTLCVVISFRIRPERPSARAIVGEAPETLPMTSGTHAADAGQFSR